MTLYVDDKAAASANFRTQSGRYELAGEGVAVGRNSADPVSKEYLSGFAFTGGQIFKVLRSASVAFRSIADGWWKLSRVRALCREIRRKTRCRKASQRAIAPTALSRCREAPRAALRRALPASRTPGR